MITCGRENIQDKSSTLTVGTYRLDILCDFYRIDMNQVLKRGKFESGKFLRLTMHALPCVTV